MSLIFGINLSDRIYLSADTRLTIEKSDKTKEYKDNIIKIIPFPSPIAVAVAGKTKAARFIVQRLLKDEKSLELSIRSLRENILEKIGPIVDELLSLNFSYEQARVCLLFGGLNKSDRKKVAGGKKLIELVGECQNLEKKSDERLMTKLLDKNFHGNRNLVANALINSQQNLKDVHFRALMNQKVDEEGMVMTDVVDSHVFAVLLNPPNPPVIEDAEWGEFLAYGSIIKKEKIPKNVFCKLEFKSSGKVNIDHALLTAVVESTAREYKLDTVGGSIFSIVIIEKGGGALTGEVNSVSLETGRQSRISKIISDGKGVFYTESPHGERHRLVPFTELDESIFSASADFML